MAPGRLSLVLSRHGLLAVLLTIVSVASELVWRAPVRKSFEA